MNIKIWLLETSQPIELTGKNSYTKGGLYCVYKNDGIVVKYPLCNIFRIEETY